MNKIILLLAGLIVISVSPHNAAAKELAPGSEKKLSGNKAVIRTNGLACYFCAYGLERHFKKTGKIASFDIDMKKGLVTVDFIKKKPVVLIHELRKFVYDSGFTPLWIEYSLVGTIVGTFDQPEIILREMKQVLKLGPNEKLRPFIVPSGGSKPVQILVRVEEKKTVLEVEKINFLRAK